MDLTPVKAAPLDDDEMAAWFEGRRPRRLLAIPFHGPISGADMDGQTFSPATDIRPDWLPFRDVDWHHGQDALFGRDVIGKADRLGSFDGQLGEPDEDGWWVDLWWSHGERRKRLIQQLVNRGADLFGSSESIAELAKVRTAKGVVPWQPNLPGEIVYWPYWRQTLTTSPQNTHSVLRPVKAVLEDVLTSDYTPSPDFWADFADELRSLGSTLRTPPGMGGDGAKAGRVLSSVNEADIEAALERLLSLHLVTGTELLQRVLARHRKESTT